MTIRSYAILFSLVAVFLCGCRARRSDHTLAGTPRSLYTITDIGTGEPHWINDKGQVVGAFPAGVFPNSKDFPYFHGFLWDNGKRTEMKTFGGWYSDAGQIADNGQIIGSASVPGHDRNRMPIEHGCLWQRQKMTDLEADPRFRGTGAIHITQSGAVYAISPPIGSMKLFHLWFYPSGFAPGVRIDKGVIGGPVLKPFAINDAGKVIGTWDTGEKRNKNTVARAFLWKIGQRKWIDLGTLGGLGSEPTALNNAGQIVGISDLPDDPASPRARTHAFLWQQGKMRDLGALANGSFSFPKAINDKGQIVGFSEVNQRSLELLPVLWEAGKIKDLSLLIPAGTKWSGLSGAASINNRGQIVGSGGLVAERWEHGYLLTPS